MENVKLRLALAGWRSVADLIYLIFNNLWAYRKKVIVQNLAECFPVISENEIKLLSKKYFRHLADLIVEPFLIGQLKSGNFNKLVSYDNMELVHRLIADKKDIVLMASHYGNWEYLLALPLVAKCDVLAAYSPLTNRFLDKKLLKMRSRFGIKLVPKSDWYRTVLKWDHKAPAIFITIADQRPAGPVKNHLEFMNMKTFVQPGAARIAISRNCAVVYLDVQKKARNRYRFSFKLLAENPENMDENQIMRQYYQSLESTIKRQPELWLWSHNRWKCILERKKYVKIGKLAQNSAKGCFFTQFSDFL
ncbi:lysophospholipid acyltransferase family protein [Dyadobacter sp. CY323]|uniref:lysophospholipid acyltransferase family protein n=1 Tax=Dyadobacter sp. CY323 TaxID=2907302 RepID=UPI001F3568EE|nr:lysophospholipid acyltransferase family protein [Dyadobacter sp. CY323]MCE6991747.1 lysophospholipid acyltransferase family protein [Dyadobacter sp. CY323]